MSSVAAAQAASPAWMVNLEGYPLLTPESPRWQEVVTAARRQIAARGAAEIPDFLSPAGLQAMLDDARRLATTAHRGEGYGTAYLDVADPQLPEDHPRRYIGRAAVGVVAYDMFPADSPMLQLYEWDVLMEFIGAVLQKGKLFRYADPLGALNLAVMRDNDELQWHFDMTDFVVSLAIQDAEEGGDFEVAPLIRSAGDERYARVRQVLEGTSDEVIRLPMTPGTLLIFEGRYSIHRVSPIHGPTPRLVGLLAYDTKPGTNSTEVLKLSRYGRVA